MFSGIKLIDCCQPVNDQFDFPVFIGDRLATETVDENRRETHGKFAAELIHECH